MSNTESFQEETIDLSKNNELKLSETETSEYLELYNKLLEAKLFLANLEFQKVDLMNQINHMNQTLVEMLTKFANQRELDLNKVKFNSEKLSFVEF